MKNIKDHFRRVWEEAARSLDRLSSKRGGQSREKMIEELESRGYPARGKTDAEIEEMVKRPPPNKHG